MPAPQIALRPLTADNAGACAKLALHDHQKTFIAPIADCMAAVNRYPDNHARCIYADDHLVGFALYGIEQPTGRVKLFRLMIDASHQNHGIGRAAMPLILNEIEARYHPNEIYVSYQSNNPQAQRLYHTFDFKEVERENTKITARRLQVMSKVTNNK